MEIGERIVEFVAQLSSWTPLVAFFAPFVGGETAVLLMAFFAGEGTLPLWGVIVGSFLGMLTLDVFWFWVPRSPWAERFKRYARVSPSYRSLEARIESLSHRNDIAILFISKVLIGTRILVLAYLSVRSISFKRFIAYNSIATLIWSLILGFAGWFAGLGFYALGGVENVFAGMLYIAAFLGLVYTILWLIRQFIKHS